MSATTPAVGGIGTQRLAAALAAVALAVVVLVAIIGLQAMASRSTTIAPAAAPAPASVFDHGTSTDTTAPKVLLELPRPFDPSQLPETPVGGGHGTRFAR
jgi:hypothetical protein